MKNKFCSYNINELPEGCKYCIKGEKLVLFISGKCSRNCWYCSLSELRKNKDDIYANERKIKNIKGLIEEIKESNATSMGITGGDPILVISRTLAFARAAKKNFGKKFHIHIYLPTKLITKNKLKWISKYVDEVRFNPEITIDKKKADFDIEKIKIALKFWKKENIGIELPMIPDSKKDYLDFILKIKDYIGFVNLNEFELSETNMKKVVKKYNLNEGGYTIQDSIKSGIWILNELKKKKTKLKVHLCTAKLKNEMQFRNRLLRHRILPFGYRTKEGMVKYLISYKKPSEKDYFYDKKKKRYILSENLAKKLIKNKKKVILVEEFPSFDRFESEMIKIES